MKQKHKSCLFVVEEGKGNIRPLLRGVNPARGLKEHGWRTKSASVLYEEGDMLGSQTVSRGTFNGWSPGETEPTDTTKYIVSRPLLMPEKGSKPDLNDHLQVQNMKLVQGSNRDIIECAREHGQYFFMDLDDDIWNIPEWNPASQTIDEYRENWIDDVNSSNGLIVSTWNIWYQAQKTRIKIGRAHV